MYYTKIVKFEWDPIKAEMNYKKHQIRFEEAQTVFLDVHAVEFFDTEHSDDDLEGGDRFLRIGMSLKMKVLIVVYCERHGNSIRIISARKADKTERRSYE